MGVIQLSIQTNSHGSGPEGLSKESVRPGRKQRFKLSSEWPIAGGNPVRTILQLLLYGVDDDNWRGHHISNVWRCNSCLPQRRLSLSTYKLQLEFHFSLTTSLNVHDLSLYMLSI